RESQLDLRCLRAWEPVRSLASHPYRVECPWRRSSSGTTSTVKAEMNTTATPERPIVGPEAKEAIKTRLTEIQAELDEIGATFGMNRRRLELNREKDELLDALLDLLGAKS